MLFSMTGVVWPVYPKEKVKISATFLDPAYPSVRRNMGLPPDEHPGIDINISGLVGNEDLGYPVVSMSEGVVLRAREHRVWGKVVLIHHPTLRKLLSLEHEVYTQYAHLHHICVSEGDYVYPGFPIGSIGRGDPLQPFIAHLHFEIRRSGPDVIPEDYWPKYRNQILKHYLDPVDFINRYYKPMTFSFPEASVFSDGTLLSLRGVIIVNASNPKKVFVRKV